MNNVDVMLEYYQSTGTSIDPTDVEDMLRELDEAGFLLVNTKDDVAEEKLRDLLMKWFKDDDDGTPWVMAQYLAENIAIDILTVLNEDDSE